jgi:hypothetical protein
MNPESTCTETTHRIGKIARLPAAIRQQLNQRLEDNEPGPQVLEWLHALPEVKKVLKRLFADRPISEQNLSAWKQGGFRDWQRHQQVRARAHEFLEEGRELTEEVAAPAREGGGGSGSLLDRVGDRIALGLLELFREAEAGEPGPERERRMLAIAREVARLRRGDHERQQAALAQERWQHERDLTLREVREHEEEKRQEQEAALCAQARELRAELIRGLAFQDIAQERGQWICEFLGEHEELLKEHGEPGLPKDELLKRELAVEMKKPEYQLHRYYKEMDAKRAAEEGGSSQVKAAQGKSRSKNSTAAAAEDTQPKESV